MGLQSKKIMESVTGNSSISGNVDTSFGSGMCHLAPAYVCS